MGATKQETPVTIGTIASKLGVPVHRVAYAIETRNIEHLYVAGNARVYAPGVVDRVAAALKDIGTRSRIDFKM